MTVFSIFIFFAKINGAETNPAYTATNLYEAEAKFLSEHTLVNGDSYQVFRVKSMEPARNPD